MPDFTSISTWRSMFTRHGAKLGWGLVILFGVPMVLTFGLSGYGKGGQQDDRKANLSEVVMRVNGKDVPRSEVAKYLDRTGAPGEQAASTIGQGLQTEVKLTILRQMADESGVHVSDSDVDKAVADAKEKLVGKDGSDEEWRKAVASRGMSVREFRNSLMNDPRLLANAMLVKGEAAVKVTDDAAKNQTAEVKYDFVVIPSTDGKTPVNPMMQQGKIKPILEADAKKKADDLLAKVKAGAGIQAIAKANSGDFSSARGGVVDYTKEFAGQGGETGIMGHGKDFDEAIHKAAKGQLTDVIKVSGMSSGYAFAKVLDRRNNLPKDFDVRKAVTDLRKQRAGQKLNDDLEARFKAAKVDFVDPDLKAYYDYGKLAEAKNKQMYAQFGQAVPDAPTAEQVAALDKTVQEDFEGVVKRNPKDATPAIILAGYLDKQKNDLKLPQAQRDAIADRLITLYTVALAGTEDSEMRLNLAALYRDKKQMDKAAEQYTMTERMLNVSPPTDAQTAQTAQQTYTRVSGGFQSIGKTQEAAEAKKKADEMMMLAAQKQAEQKAEQARQEQERKAKADADAKAKAEAAKKPGGAAVAPGGASLAPPTGGAGSPAGVTVTPVTPGAGTPVTPTPVTPTPATPTK